MATRKKVISYTTTYPPFQDFYSAVPFAVSPDGTLLLVGTCSDIDVLDDFICLGGDVEVFNVATGKELAVVSTSINEVYGIAVAPDGRTAYVSSSEQPICEGCADALPVNALSAIDLATFTLGSSLSLGNTVYPTMITIAPNGKTLYLGTYGASLLSISLPALKINQTVPVTGSVNIGLSANGVVLIAAASADVTNLGADTITVLNPANLSILGTVAVPPYSRDGFAVGPAGGDVYLGNGSVITQVNTSSLSVTRTIEVHHESSLALTNLGETLLELQVEAGVDSGNAVVGVFTKGTLQPVRNLYTPSQASWLAVSPDGSTLYQAVAGDAAGGVQAVSLSTGALLQTYLPNGLVASMALSPDGKTLYAVGFPFGFTETPPDYLWIVNTSTGAFNQITLPYTIPAPLYENGIAIALSPDGTTLAIDAPVEPVLIVDAATERVTGNINAVGGSTIAFDPTGKFVYFQTTGIAPAKYVVVADLATRQILTTLPIAGAAIAFSPTLPVVYISDGTAAISVVNTSTYQVENTIPVVTGSGQGMAVTPDGTLLYADGSQLAGNPVGAIVDTSTFTTQPFFGIDAIVIY